MRFRRRRSFSGRRGVSRRVFGGRSRRRRSFGGRGLKVGYRM